MSAQLISALSEIKTYLPWVSFLAGMGGSLHCVGMCGGLVTASCEGSKDVVRYQFGRLLGYLLLGALAGFLGNFLNFKSAPIAATLIPSLLVGGLFIFWGVQALRGRKAELPMPKFFGQLYTKLWRALVQKNKNLTRAFFTGFISILLPCGLLYGIVLSTVALQNMPSALMAMLFFWLGTVPAMVVAPGIIQRLLKPFKAKLPKVYAISLMLIGVMTISFRIVKIQNVHSHSHGTAAPETKVMCH